MSGRLKSRSSMPIPSGSMATSPRQLWAPFARPTRRRSSSWAIAAPCAATWAAWHGASTSRMRKPARKDSHRSTRSSPGCVWPNASPCASTSMMCPRASFSPPARQPPWKSTIDLGRRCVNRMRAPFGSERERGGAQPAPERLTRIFRGLSIESRRDSMADTRKESDSLGVVEVPADKLWGAQTQRSLEHFSIGKDLIPRETITAYAILKKAAAAANHAGKRLDDQRYNLIVQACDEILAGKHHDMFPLHVWMTGSGTQFNMNVNEVISNRCSQLAGTPLGSKAPVHPNDHVNMAQSSNDTFPSAMYIAAAVNVKQRLVPAVAALRDAIGANAQAWEDIVKIGRTHMQDATPLTLGQEWSGYAGMLSDDLDRIEAALQGVYRLALGGTAVGTGINSAPGFAEAAAAEIARLT